MKLLNVKILLPEIGDTFTSVLCFAKKNLCQNEEVMEAGLRHLVFALWFPCCSQAMGGKNIWKKILH